MIQKKKSQLNSQEQQKKKRRKGNEIKQERSFKCFCGKTYLSYPALYLHKKLKHSDQVEDQINSNNHNSDHQLNENEKSQEEHSKNISLQQLVNFIKQCNESFVIKDEENHDISNPEVQKEYIQEFPKDWFNVNENFQPLLENLQQIYNKLTDTGEFEEDEIDSIQDIKLTKCNKIFALFLAKLSKYLTKEGFKEIAYFIAIFRITLNKVGWKSITNVSENQKEKEYCQEQSGEYCLEACNDLIINYIPDFMKVCPYDKFKVVDNESMGKSVKLTQYFSAWLFDNNYTHSKLLLSKDD